MEDDGLDCDVETVLECRENEKFDVLQRLSASCQEFRASVSAFVESCIHHEKEIVRKCEELNKQILCLHTENKEKISQRDDTILQQKLTDKKLAIMEKQVANCESEIEDLKLKKESIALELVDLMQELSDSRKQRKARWNAIKMACSIYKEKLEFHIQCTEFEDQERVQVTFFLRKNPDKETYYVHLFNYGNNWKVGQIEPPLKDIHSEDLKAVIDFTKPLNLPGTTAFLCKLRSIFLKHYFKE